MHDKLNAKYIKLITQVDEEISELTKTLELLKKTMKANSETETSLAKDITAHLSNLENRVDKLKREKKDVANIRERNLKVKIWKCRSYGTNYYRK